MNTASLFAIFATATTFATQAHAAAHTCRIMNPVGSAPTSEFCSSGPSGDVASKTVTVKEKTSSGVIVAEHFKQLKCVEGWYRSFDCTYQSTVSVETLVLKYCSPMACEGTNRATWEVVKDSKTFSIIPLNDNPLRD